jgi:ATP-dependent exoDNAse (exonuclease V) alpha subunit
VTVVGHAAVISAGEWIMASGQWVNDRTHGQQFKARFLRTSAPTSVDGIEKYLSSGMIRGVGPVYAKKLVRAFGEKIFDIIEASPDRLLKTADAIAMKLGVEKTAMVRVRAGIPYALTEAMEDQLTLTRYLGNRRQWVQKHEQKLELPDHYPVREEMHVTTLRRFISRLKNIGIVEIQAARGTPVVYRSNTAKDTTNLDHGFRCGAEKRT